MEAIPSEAERARGTFWVVILVMRWAWYLWMVGLAISTRERHVMEPLAWTSLVLVGAWTIWLTFPGHQQRPETPWIDLAIGVALIIVSAFVMDRGEVIGQVPFFAVMYPAASALLWGTAKGPGGGLFAGAILSAALAVGRPLNGVPLDDVTTVLGLANGIVQFLAVGLAAGVFSSLMTRWAEQFRGMMEQLIKARERAARLAEHNSMAGEIHDSVVQSLGLMKRLGRDLSSKEQVAGAEVGELADLASEQEQALRDLIRIEPLEAPSGKASLRAALEATRRSAGGVPTSVSAVGPIWLPASVVEETSAAVGQALANVARHAEATRAAIFAEVDDASVIVSVRDNGRGFEYDEAKLRRDGKAGLLTSMKGRVEGLGGRMRVVTAPGLGTDVEFRIPLDSSPEATS